MRPKTNKANSQERVAINDVRVAKGLPALGIRSNCVLEAEFHSQDMYEKGYYSHDSPTETATQRFIRFGLTAGSTAGGENIAAGLEDVSFTVQAWVNSPEHYANIINSKYKATGVGYAGNLWTQCFTSLPPDQ